MNTNKIGNITDSIDDDSSNAKHVNIEKHMIDVIKNSKHIDHVMMGEILDDITKDKILEMLLEPKPFKLTDRGLVYINSDNDEVECVSYGTNITADGRWLSDKIDPITFDIDQNGNLRKASEAQAAYCLGVIYSVLGDPSIKDEIEEVVENYDFNNMSPFNDSYSFSQLLSVYQSEQTTTINICVSAAKYNIANIKKDSEKYLKDNLPEARISALRELNILISNINRSYSLNKLSPDNVKSMNKLERLMELDKRDKEIRFILDGGIDEEGNRVQPHSESVLWKIQNLSSEYISPIKKRRLSLLAETEVTKLFEENPNLMFESGEKKQLIDKWKKRYVKFARQSVRREQLNKYLENESFYSLPVKL